MNSLFQIIAALGLGTGAIAAFLIWRARQPTAPKPVCCGAPAAEIEETQHPYLQRLLRAIDYLRTRREWRYRTPWILLLGQENAGKSSLLASMPPEHRQPLQGKQHQLAVSGADWQFFGNGFLIDPKGSWPAAAAAGENSKDAKEWTRVLDEIDALRPERALDGIVLVVSATTLQHASAADRLILAENARQQLRTVQERFEFALPVYVVVTATDMVEGFAAFWRAQPEQRRSEIFGWSAPSQLNNGLPAEWADAAFDHIGLQLKALQVDAAVTCERIAAIDVDQFFLFPRHLQQLRAPFSQWISTVFQPSAWQAGFFCRGIYFTGHVAPSGNTASKLERPRTDLAFVSDLVLKKVLAEPRLGRPTRQGVWSRSSLIRSIQLGAIAVIATLLLAFAIATVQVNYQVDAVIASLKQMQQLDQPPASSSSTVCIAQEPVYQLLDQIARIDANTTHWSIPLSAIDSRLSKKSARRIADTAFQNVILPGLACQLRQRADELIGASSTDSTTYTQSVTALYDTIEQVETLERNRTRFDSLTGAPPYTKGQLSLPEFIALVEYAYRNPLSAKVKTAKSVLPTVLAANSSKTKLSLPSNFKQSTSTQIAQQAGQVHRQLQQELSEGSRLLTKLEQKQEPVLTHTKEFANWLTWVRKSWLGSSTDINPFKQIQADLTAKLNPLTRQYGYTDPALAAASKQFGNNTEYQSAMKMLSNLQMPSYGQLFTVQNKVLDLNPKLATEQAGLNALMALDFMQVDSPAPFICQSKISGWSASRIAMANNYAQEYDRFARNQGLPSTTSTPDQRPLYDRLARYQLELAMNDSLRLAQIPAASATPQVGIDYTSQGDSRAAQESADFNKLLQPILGLQQVYRDKEFNSGATIAQCVRNFAANSLGQIQSLADQSQLYQAAPNNADTSAASDAAFFDLGSVPVIKDYLASQIDRVEVLTRYATPFVNYLNNSDAPATTQRSNTEGAPYWNNTIVELNSALQAKDPNGQAALLDNLFLKQFPGLTNANCAATLAAYKPEASGNDLFSTRRQQLEKQVELRCKGVRHSQAYTDYNALAARFNRELAGHYPFAPIDTNNDSDTATVKNFFTDYAVDGPALRQSLNGLNDQYWDDARQFLDQLDAVAQFFQGNLIASDAASASTGSAAKSAAGTSSANNNAPAIKLTVVFRAQASDSPGSNQVVNWSLSSGSKSIGRPNRPDSLDWAYGQPLIVDLDWANYSLLRPAADSNQRDLKVEGTLASFDANGAWALLRLIQSHRPASGPQTDPLDAKRLLLQFNVPVTSAETRFSKTQRIAKLYLALSMSGTSSPASLKLPATFPLIAPQ